MIASMRFIVPIVLGAVAFITNVCALSSYSTCPDILVPKTHSCPSEATVRPSPYATGFIPIVNVEICAEPPGTISTDGCDDVCLLVECCNGWQTETGVPTVQLPNGKSVDCTSVNCGNVCRMACDREGTAEAFK
jgi:hypothetical protein